MIHPGTRLAHRLGTAGPHPERWTARVLWATARHVGIVWDCDCRVTVVARSVVEKGWVWG